MVNNLIVKISLLLNPMQQTTKYLYSRNAALIVMSLPSVFLAITLTNLTKAFDNGFSVRGAIIATAGLVFIIQLVYLFITRLLPALQNKTALEFNNTGIADYVKKVELDWSAISSIKLETGSSPKLIIELKEETNYGKEIIVNLKWVSGNYNEISDNANAYLEKKK